MKSVCENCFNTIDVREEAIGKRYRCKACGATCVVQAEEDEYFGDSPVSRPQKPRRPSTRKPKRSRSSEADGSIVRGVGFGCLLHGAGVSRICRLQRDDHSSSSSRASMEPPSPWLYCWPDRDVRCCSDCWNFRIPATQTSKQLTCQCVARLNAAVPHCAKENRGSL